jgi:hypothetical protein
VGNLVFSQVSDLVFLYLGSYWMIDLEASIPVSDNISNACFLLQT